MHGSFYSVTRSDYELSIVCPQANIPQGAHCDSGWRNLKIEGPLDFSLTGVLTSIVGPLAEVGISIFSISTYDTDYVLVKDQDLSRTVIELSRAGHLVAGDEDSLSSGG